MTWQKGQKHLHRRRRRRRREGTQTSNKQYPPKKEYIEKDTNEEQQEVTVLFKLPRIVQWATRCSTYIFPLNPDFRRLPTNRRWTARSYPCTIDMTVASVLS